MKLTLKDIKERIFVKYGEGFAVLSDYEGIDNLIKLKHIDCGYEWSQTPYNFLNGKGCPKCTRIRCNNQKRKPQKVFEREVYEKYGSQYTVLGKYHNCHTPIKMKHNYFFDSSKRKIVCGKEFYVSNPIAFLKREGRRTTCSHCKNKIKVYVSLKDTKLDDTYLFCIYKHVNKINGKVYIGITSVPFKARWAKGNKYKDNIYFFNSISKYSWSNFKHYILISNRWVEVREDDNLIDKYSYTFNEACELEKKYVKYYRDKYGRDNVYNATDGGEGLGTLRNKGVLQYDLDGNFIKEYESARKASVDTGVNYSCICMCCNNKSQSAGRFLWKFKGSDKKIKRPDKINNRFVNVLRYDLKGNYLGTYKSIADAARQTKCSENGIFNCCHNKQLRTGNSQWKYENSEKQIKDITELLKNPIYKKNYKKVLQYDFSGNLIAEYKNIWEVKKAFGTIFSIKSCCLNKCFTAKNFIWVYDDEAKEENLIWHLEKVKNGHKKTSYRVYRFSLSGELILPIYINVGEASLKLGINSAAIYSCCEGCSVTCKNYIFLYELDVERNLKKRLDKYNEIKRAPRNKKRIFQYSREDIFIKEFPSIRKASEEIGVNSSTICEVIDKDNRTAGGFRWKSRGGESC